MPFFLQFGELYKSLNVVIVVRRQLIKVTVLKRRKVTFFVVFKTISWKLTYNGKEETFIMISPRKKLIWVVIWKYSYKELLSPVLDLLQLCFWNKVMLLQNWTHHYKSFMVVIVKLWIVTVYPSASWEPICSPWHSFLFFFVYPGINIL